MKVWIVMWGGLDGYSDDIRVFSTKEKVYEHIKKEYSKILNFYIENRYERLEYYQNKYYRLIDNLCETFKQNHTAFSVEDFNSNCYYEVQQIEVDSE